jgi:hypothetical protein
MDDVSVVSEAGKGTVVTLTKRLHYQRGESMNEKVTPPESMNEAVSLIWEYQQSKDNEIATTCSSRNTSLW